MRNFLRTLWPKRQGGARITVLDPPVSLESRHPRQSETDPCGYCWWGRFLGDIWVWRWDRWPAPKDTHFLPAGVDALPAQCFNPRRTESS